MHTVSTRLLTLAVLTALAFARWGNTSELPDRIRIDVMQDLYGAVTFDHAAHIRTIYDCAVCHHHTTGAQVTDPNCIRCHRTSNPTKTVACRSCHRKEPFSSESMREKRENPNRYHNDTPGLMGAYHQNCLGCHRKMSGPTGCQGCHARTPKGDARFNAGLYAPRKTGNERHATH